MLTEQGRLQGAPRPKRGESPAEYRARWERWNERHKRRPPVPGPRPVTVPQPAGQVKPLPRPSEEQRRARRLRLGRERQARIANKCGIVADPFSDALGLVVGLLVIGLVAILI